MSTTFPTTGRIAGIDYGAVRIGVAVTDPERRLASPLEVYARRSPTADADYFRRLAADERLVGFVVGLPVFSSGDESPKSLEARRFADWLTEITKLPVVLFDERYSTVLADQFLSAGRLTRRRRQERRDMLAAQVILATFLESGQKPTGEAKALDER